MAQKKSYSRYFIILQEDEKGYALATDKTPTGYVKLELKMDKCKVSYYVQNLKKESTPYHMILICNKKDSRKLIDIGEVNIDNYGRSDVSYEYPIDSVGGSEISADRICGGAIIKVLDSNIISIMNGFLTKDIPNWKKFDFCKTKVRSEENKEKQKKEVNIFDKYEQDIEVNKNAEKVDRELKNKTTDNEIEENKQKIEKEEKQDSKEEMIDKSKIEEKEEVKDVEKLEENKEQKIKEKAPKIKETYKKEKNKLNDIKIDKNSNLESKDREFDTSKNAKYPCGVTGDFFKKIVNKFEEVTGICNEIKRCKWYKVSINNIENMYDTSDYDKYVIAYYPMISYYPYIKDYGYYVLGYKCDKKGEIKYIIYGVPGKKSSKYQPYAGKSGFVTWVPNEMRDSNEDGYWLMFYDFRDSSIIIPIK